MRHQTRPRFGFYGVIAMLNLATGLMFFVVTRPLPVAYAADLQIPAALHTKKASVPAIVGTPVRLEIPSLAIDLPVGEGSYDTKTGEWTTGLSEAYHADVSMPINDSNGVTLIYGHAQTPIFINLPQIGAAALATVYTDNGYKFTYTYTTKIDVVPTDTSLFRSDGPPTLVLQTCTGDWDRYRALFSFSLTKVQKT